MLTVEQVKNNVSNYKIENGIVIDKSTNQKVENEEKVLEVKSSVIMYKEAKDLFDSRLRGAPENPDFYINKAITIYGLNGEINDYPQNKIIRNIINGNGSIKEDYGNNELGEKYSFLDGPKKDYGLAVVNYIAHQNGIDISDLNVSIDSSNFKKIGVSEVYINYNKNQYIKKKEEQKQNDSRVDSPAYHHPKEKELNELEEQKRISKANNDEVLYNYAQSNIEKIIKENPTSVTSEKWDSMTIDEQILYVQLKVNESKVLHDKEAFDYWSATKTNLENKKKSNQENKSEFSESIEKLRQKIDKVNDEYKEMLSDGYIDDNELAILMKRIKDLNKETLSLSTMVSNQEEQMLISSIMQILSDEQKKILSAQDTSNENNHKL